MLLCYVDCVATHCFKIPPGVIFIHDTPPRKKTPLGDISPVRPYSQVGSLETPAGEIFTNICIIPLQYLYITITLGRLLIDYKKHEKEPLSSRTSFLQES